MFINCYRPFLAMAVRIWYITSAISVDKSNMGLTFVHRDISVQVENLNLEYNRVIRITNMSFIQFIQLDTLKLSGNELTYIEMVHLTTTQNWKHYPRQVTIACSFPTRLELQQQVWET